MADDVNLFSNQFNTGLSNTPTYSTGSVGNVMSDPNVTLSNPLGAESAPRSGFSENSVITEQKYNELYYNVELYLDNSGNFDADPKNRYYINPAAVLGMNISDTVTDWVVDGSLTFMYLPEDSKPTQATTTGNPAPTEVGARENGEVVKSYQFRGDGFDLLRVLISPKSTPSAGSNAIDLDGKDPKWTLCYIFSVFDMEDVNDIPTLQGPTSTYMKCIKLRFHDVRYHMLKTANIEYSTAIPKDVNIGVPSFKTYQGKLKTGEAILDILNYVLSNPELGGSPEFEQSINDTVSQDGLIEWERGSSEIFYTSPAQSSALDDINYLYSHHVSETDLLGLEDAKDLSLFHTNRNKNFGYTEKICLTPISNIFKKALEGDRPGVLQKEHFFVTAQTEENAVMDATKLFRAPTGGNGKDIDLTTFKYGQIVSYSFVDMSPAVNSEMFRTTPVYSVDIGKRVFNVQFYNNNVLAARTAISESYIKDLFKHGEDNEKLFLPIIHHRKKAINIFPTFSLNGDDTAEGKILRQKNGLHNLLYTGLFQNACITFKTFGLTLRESGTFIAIDKTAGCDDNDYNNKLYGQWFVVKVDHSFEAGIYMNNIYAVKLHRFKELQEAFAETIDGD